MNKVFGIVLLSCLLSACSLLPVQRKFPDAPPELLKKCQDLKLVPENTTAITDMLKVVVENYAIYHECANRNSGWQQWHEKQKKTFENGK
jgi:hypothetical protein